MHSAIETRIETKRGCGYRKKGGYYLVGGYEFNPCDRLPIPLHICPTCGNGIKMSRGWTWVDVEKLVSENPCTREMKGESCGSCYLKNPTGRAGLIWVGERHYPDPHVFLNEAQSMGVSRKVKFIPHDFKLGETWVLFAHSKAIANVDGINEITYTAGIFLAFKPIAIETVVDGTETDEEIEKFVKRGIIPIKVIRDEDTQGDLFTKEAELTVDTENFVDFI